MGQCASAKGSRGHEVHIDNVHEVLETTMPTSTSALDYSVIISNIKLKNVPYQGVSCHVSLGDHHEFMLQAACCNGQVKWSEQLKAQLSLTEQELRTKFLVFSIRNNEQKEVASTRFNLYLISVGPYHHNFPIQYQGKEQGRIYVDVRMSRLIEMTVVPQNVSVKLNKAHPGQAFHFSLKTFVKVNVIQSQQEHEYQTDDSYDTEISLYNKKMTEAELKEMSLRSPLLKSPMKRKVLEGGNELFWTQKEAEERGAVSLPIIKTKYCTSQLPNESFQFLLWKVQQIYQEENQCLVDLYAESYVSFNKIFSVPPTECQATMERHVNITEKMYNKGKQYGHMTFSCKVTVPKFNTQMVAYIRTEDGIQLVHTEIKRSIKNDRFDCEELIRINKLKENFDITLTELNEIKSKKMQFHILKLKRNVYQALDKLIPMLESGKSNMFNYKSDEELSRGQNILIDIGFLLFNYLQEQDNQIRQCCWKALTVLSGRGEFNMCHMTFSEEEKKHIRKENIGKKLKGKIDTYIKYQGFLYFSLKMVLQCLNKKAILENEREFAEQFCAYAYFRIPDFREKLLEVLTQEGDMAIDDWANINFNNTECGVNPLFDWQGNFYGPISHLQKFQQNYSQLKTILQDDRWKARMAKRGVPFYEFLSHWVKYVQRTSLVSQNVIWHYLPGYNTLIKAFVSSLKTKKLVEFPDSLAEAATRLLANENLLNLFVYLILKKTYSYDSPALLKCVQILQTFFRFFKFMKKKLPSTFIYPVLYEALKIILEGQHYYAISKFLLVIYNNYSLFNTSFKKSINMFLMGKVFFKLFLSYSIHIRTVFHNILLYRIHFTEFLQVKTDLSTDNEIRERYRYLMRVINSAQEITREDSLARLAATYEKDYFKKMRSKMLDIRRKKENRRKIRYKVEEFISPKRVERIYSETFADITEQPILSKNSEKTSMTEKKKRKSSFMDLETIPENPCLSKRTSIRKPSNELTDTELTDIDACLLPYLEMSLKEFSRAEDIYKENEQTLHKNPEMIPDLKIKVPLDEGDIRPEQIEEW